ncbi:helix-turn-helix transcriptional regulator [Salmonella enterica subsp. enterica]|nr:helix-turn-helix transcriptional regulator [Salmonella enterica subsp. enterica]
MLRALPHTKRRRRTAICISRQLVARLVSSNFRNPPTLDTLAQVCLSVRTLIRTFKRDTGLTPVGFTNMARIGLCPAPIARRGRYLPIFAYQTGFADQSHFHKTFVSYTAATPISCAEQINIRP